MSTGSDPKLESSSEAPPSKPAARARRRAAARDQRAVQRFAFEGLLLRLVATCGVIAIGIAIAAIMHSSGSQGWLIGLIVATVSVVMSGVIWSGRAPRV
jgi:hypothetical protein